MADTRADVTIPAKTWVNLYTLSGITVGTAVTVFNKSSRSFNLAIKATSPAIPTDAANAVGYPVAVFPNSLSFASIPPGNSGLWAWSEFGARVLVQD